MVELGTRVAFGTVAAALLASGIMSAARSRRRSRLAVEGLVAHSDRDGRYDGEHHQRLLAGRGIICSMSRRGDRRDDAPMESSCASPKKELVHDAHFAARAGARTALSEDIEVSCHRVRRHSAPGYLPPAEYERAP